MDNVLFNIKLYIWDRFAKCKTVVTLLLMFWSYRSIAISRRYVIPLLYFSTVLAFCRRRFPTPSIIPEFHDKPFTCTEPPLPPKLHMSDPTSVSGVIWMALGIRYHKGFSIVTWWWYRDGPPWQQWNYNLCIFALAHQCKYASNTSRNNGYNMLTYNNWYSFQC